MVISVNSDFFGENFNSLQYAITFNYMSICFLRFLQTERDLNGLFAGLSKSQNGDYYGNVEFDDILVTKHASVVMETLASAVECLEDTVYLTGVLVALGEIHAMYRVRPQHLAVSFHKQYSYYSHVAESESKLFHNFILGNYWDKLNQAK